MIYSAVYLCSSNHIEAENRTNNVSSHKPSRNAEAYTTILLDDESFSLEPIATYPRLKNIPVSSKQKYITNKNLLAHANRNSNADVLKDHHDLRKNKVKSGVMPLTNSTTTTTKREKDIIRIKKIKKLNHIKNQKHTPSKKIHKKRFVADNRHSDQSGGSVLKHKPKMQLGKPHRFELRPVTHSYTEQKTGDERNSYQVKYENTPSIYEEKPSSTDYKPDDLMKYPYENSEDETVYFSSLKHDNNIPTTRRSINEYYPTSPWPEQRNSQEGNFPYHSTYNPNIMNHWAESESSRIYSTSSSINSFTNTYSSNNSPWIDTTEANFHEKEFYAEDIVQRSLLKTSDKPKTEKEQTEDQLRIDE